MVWKVDKPFGVEVVGRGPATPALIGLGRICAQEALHDIQLMGGKGIKKRRKALDANNWVEAIVIQNGPIPYIKVKVFSQGGVEEKELIIAIPFEVYVRGSAYAVDEFYVEGRTKVYVAEFTIAGDFKSLAYLGDTLPEGVKLTDEEKENGDTIFSWDKYQKCGPYLVAGTTGMTMGEFAEPGATSACGYKYIPIFYEGKASVYGAGSNNRYYSQIKGNIYNEGKIAQPLPGTVSGAVMVKGGLVLMGQLYEGKLNWYKKEDNKWEKKEIDLDDETLTTLSQSFQFTMDEEGGGATGVAFAGYNPKTLYSKARVDVTVTEEAEVFATASVLFNTWEYCAEKEESEEAVYETAQEMQQIQSAVVREDWYRHGTVAQVDNLPVLWFPVGWSTYYVDDMSLNASYSLNRIEFGDKEYSSLYYELASASIQAGHIKTITKYRKSGDSWVNLVYTEDTTKTEVVITDGWPMYDYSGNTSAIVSFTYGNFLKELAARVHAFATVYSGFCDASALFLVLRFALRVEKENTKSGTFRRDWEYFSQAGNAAYRNSNNLSGETFYVDSSIPVTIATTDKKFEFFSPSAYFTVGPDGSGPPPVMMITSDPWLRMGIEFVYGCGLRKGAFTYAGVGFADYTHTSTQVRENEFKITYNPQFGTVGQTALLRAKQEDEEKEYYTKHITKATQFYTNKNPLGGYGQVYNILCPATVDTEQTIEAQWESWYVFEGDPEYSIAVVYKFILDEYKFTKKIDHIYYDVNALPYCVVDHTEEFPEIEEINRIGQVALYYAGDKQKELGHNYYNEFGEFLLSGESGPMVRPPFAPYALSYNTPLNSIEASAPYGSSIVTQFFGVDHYAALGICDGRIYSLPQKTLDLALASGGWWMRDAGDNGPNASYSNEVLSIKNQTLAAKIKKWFDDKYPSDSQQDYRFLGLSLY